MLCGWEGELAKSNGSLPPGGWLVVTYGLTACTSGSAPGPMLRNEYGKPLPFEYNRSNKSFNAKAKYDFAKVTYHTLWREVLTPMQEMLFHISKYLTEGWLETISTSAFCSSSWVTGACCSSRNVTAYLSTGISCNQRPEMHLWTKWKG